MSRHLKARHPAEYGMEKNQTQISKASMEKRGKLFKYKDDVYRDSLNMIICGLNLGFNSVESPELRHYHGGALNLQVHAFSSKTMSKYAVKEYHKRKTELKGIFYALDTHVSICSDIWTDSWNEKSYMGVIAHWIYNNKVLNKRLIVLRKMDGSHTANNYTKH